MVDPHFKMLWNEDIPVVDHKDEAGKSTKIEVIAGSLNEVESLDCTPDSWASNSENAVGVYTVKMQPNAKWTLPKTSSDANRSIFFYKGESIELEAKRIPADHMIETVTDEDLEIQNGTSEACFLILEGKPIGEPVVKHGPFVMNTEEEIRETMREYGKTQFGGWPWEEIEVAHSRDKGRFALHSDGREEIK
jgi:redox-sensitive bicupin YhaK (pirin superfamily)